MRWPTLFGDRQRRAPASARWLLVLLAAVTLVGVPLASLARPAAGSSVSAAELLQRIQRSDRVAWAGFVHSSGGLQVPATDSFAGLAQLLGETNHLRVWWSSADRWRVDRIRSTGETDLFRQRGYSVRWVFESNTATISPVSKIRLPDASDLLPPTLARSLLQGARPEEVSRLPARRVAGRSAPGLRLDPQEEGSTVDHVDVWADGDSGLAVRVDLYEAAAVRPVVSTVLRELRVAEPAAATVAFDPPASVRVDYEEAVDVAAAANAFAADDLPAELAGLPTRDGADPGAVGVYGRGPTTVIVLPLRGQVARPLRERLQASAGVRETAVGTFALVGPVGLMLTRNPGRGGGFLLAGTVNAATLEQAATELLAGQ